jgi:hypothetical protein
MLGNVAAYSIIPPVPSAFIERIYVLVSSNNFTVHYPFTLTIVTMSPLLWSNPCTVISTLNISFLSDGSLAVVVCARVLGLVLSTVVVAINPSNRNAKEPVVVVVFFLFLMTNVCLHQLEVQVYLSWERIVHKKYACIFVK